MPALRKAFGGATSLRDAFARACDGGGGGGGGGDIPADPPSEWRAFSSTKGPDGTRPVVTEGTAVVPGTGGVMGAWTSLGVLSAAAPMKEIRVVVHTVFLAGSNRMASLDIAVDPAGGVAFAGNEIIRDLLAGAPSGLTSSAPSEFWFPVEVPVGATIGVRASSLDATVTAIRVFVDGAGDPSDAELVITGTVQTFGVPVSGTVAGTVVVPGTVAEGAWTEIGTLTRDLFYFEFGLVMDDAAMTAGLIDVDIALGGVGTERVIISNAQIVTSAAESVSKRGRGSFARGTTGEKIYARAHSSVALEANYSIAVYGVGN